jgi:tRNA(fMet)-specific endonuclease VapC
MGIVIDADVVIRAERGKFDLHNWLAGQPNQRFLIASITVAELWHGVERASAAHRPARERFVSAFVRHISVVPFTEETGYILARLWADLEKAGTRIGDYDMIVAATALSADCAVASFNVRHFSAVAGLRVVVPQ